MDRCFRQKINEDTWDLKHTIEQMELPEIYRMFNPTATEYAFFSSAQRTFSKIDHVLIHESNLSIFKMIEMYLISQ